MTTYSGSAVTNAVIAYEKPITLQQGRALRDNPIATAEGSVDAPVVAAGWHPYDMVNVGDGADGLVYDFAVSGAVASVTVTYDDGYDYLVRWHGLSPSGAGGAFRLASVAATASIIAGTTVSGSFEINMPTLPNSYKHGFLEVRNDASGSTTGPAALSGAAATPYIGHFIFNTFGGGLTSMAIDFAGVNIDAGKVYVYRRRNYVSG